VELIGLAFVCYFANWLGYIVKGALGLNIYAGLGVRVDGLVDSVHWILEHFSTYISKQPSLTQAHTR
jgi:hypothetical protein